MPLATLAPMAKLKVGDAAPSFSLPDAYGTKMLYGKEIEGVIRSTFVVDVDAEGNGTISVAQYNVRATGHVNKLRRDLGI